MLTKELLHGLRSSGEKLIFTGGFREAECETPTTGQLEVGPGRLGIQIALNWDIRGMVTATARSS